MSKSVIYEIHYQPVSPRYRMIQPFMVGGDDLKYEHNIGSRYSYAEMRCHYWAWKNPGFSACGHIGFHHYRRAFLYQPLLAPNYIAATIANSNPGDQIVVVQPGMFADYVVALSRISHQDWSEFLDDIDIIAPRPLLMGMPMWQQYGSSHRPEDWEVFAAILREEGLDDGRLPFLTAFNMFVMRRELFCEYMTLWWRIMQRLEELITPPPEGHPQARVLGFLSERLFTVWLHRIRNEQPKLKILNLPVVFADA